MAKTVSLGRFGAPSPRLMVPPSARAEEIARLMRRASILTGVLAASIGASALLVPLAMLAAIAAGMSPSSAPVADSTRPSGEASTAPMTPGQVAQLSRASRSRHNEVFVIPIS